MSAVHDFIWCHLVDLNKARINGTGSLRQHPHVVVFDIAPADSEVIDIWGSPDVLYQVVIDIEGATLEPSQAQRMFGMEPQMCVDVLTTLLDEAFLFRTSKGLFVRRPDRMRATSSD
jgi:hypothetical protein